MSSSENYCIYHPDLKQFRDNYQWTNNFNVCGLSDWTVDPIRALIPNLNQAQKHLKTLIKVIKRDLPYLPQGVGDLIFIEERKHLPNYGFTIVKVTTIIDRNQPLAGARMVMKMVDSPDFR